MSSTVNAEVFFSEIPYLYVWITSHQSFSWKCQHEHEGDQGSIRIVFIPNIPTHALCLLANHSILCPSGSEPFPSKTVLFTFHIIQSCLQVTRSFQRNKCFPFSLTIVKFNPTEPWICIIFQIDRSTCRSATGPGTERKGVVLLLIYVKIANAPNFK